MILPYTKKAQVKDTSELKENRVEIKAQHNDSSTIKVNRTEIEVVYGHYLQDGNHSAVTGGEGTEELTVYSPKASYKKIKNSINYGINAGVDVITSASTDNINSVKSSASLHDARTHTDIFYGKTNKEENFSFNVGTGFSIESDYLSYNAKTGIVLENKEKLRTYTADLKLYFDDLRWGRLSKGFFNPKTLIYPEELRDQEWFDTYRRNSYNLTLGLIQIINQRNILGFFSETSFQKGLLATPFHRVYFNDGTTAVEHLPMRRWKEGASLRWNYFLGGQTVLKNKLNGYVDNFGIRSIGFENETAIKITPLFIIKTNFRLYAQSASKYFQPFEQHELGVDYFTSDFDLSKIQSYRLGMGGRVIMPEKNKLYLPKTIEFGYGFYHRSDGLEAHVLVVGFLFGKDKKQ